MDVNGDPHPQFVMAHDLAELFQEDGIEITAMDLLDYMGILGIKLVPSLANVAFHVYIQMLVPDVAPHSLEDLARTEAVERETAYDWAPLHEAMDA